MAENGQLPLCLPKGGEASISDCCAGKVVYGTMGEAPILERPATAAFICDFLFGGGAAEARGPCENFQRWGLCKMEHPPPARPVCSLPSLDAGDHLGSSTALGIVRPLWGKPMGVGAAVMASLPPLPSPGMLAPVGKKESLVLKLLTSAENHSPFCPSSSMRCPGRTWHKGPPGPVPPLLNTPDACPGR